MKLEPLPAQVHWPCEAYCMVKNISQQWFLQTQQSVSPDTLWEVYHIICLQVTQFRSLLTPTGDHMWPLQGKLTSDRVWYTLEAAAKGSAGKGMVDWRQRLAALGVRDLLVTAIVEKRRRLGTLLHHLNNVLNTKLHLPVLSQGPGSTMTDRDTKK